MTGAVMSHGTWKTNGAMIRDVARLGFLEGSVLDLTYGEGLFWTDFQPDPDLFVACDGNPKKVPELGYCKDFTATGFQDGCADTVVFDPPYKLNGTPDERLDGRYGVDVPATIAERHDLMVRGLIEAKRLTREFVLVKCQDQVASGRVWWQTDLMTRTAEAAPFACRKVDVFHMPSYRAQPAGRRQVHARHNYSTLLVFRREAD
jgi:hypothetical protein